MRIPLPLRRSEAFLSVMYDPPTNELTITFNNGRSYTYRTVPLPVIAGLTAAADPGAYYVENIKGQYA